MFFELYNKADNDNLTRSKLTCDIFKKEDVFVVEFCQSEYSDINKWNKPKVLTDMFITRYYLPEIFGHIGSKVKLERYISDNWQSNPNMMERIEEMSKSKQSIAISLPTTVYPTRRGFPMGARGVKDTPWPLIVKVNGEDVSRAFIDFGDFKENAVATAYQALVNGKMPQSTNDIFYIDGVKSLHEELCCEGMGE